MLGYLIDPEAHTVTAVEYGGREHIADLLRCDWLEAVYLARASAHGPGLAVLVDEESRLTLRTSHEFALLNTDGSWSGAILGRGLVVGFDAEGEQTPPPIPIELARRIVHFLLERRPTLVRPE